MYVCIPAADRLEQLAIEAHRRDDHEQLFLNCLLLTFHRRFDIVWQYARRLLARVETPSSILWTEDAMAAAGGRLWPSQVDALTRMVREGRVDAPTLRGIVAEVGATTTGRVLDLQAVEDRLALRREAIDRERRAPARWAANLLALLTTSPVWLERATGLAPEREGAPPSRAIVVAVNQSVGLDAIWRLRMQPMPPWQQRVPVAREEEMTALRELLIDTLLDPRREIGCTAETMFVAYVEAIQRWTPEHWQRHVGAWFGVKWSDWYRLQRELAEIEHPSEAPLPFLPNADPGEVCPDQQAMLVATHELLGRARRIVYAHT